VAGPSGGRQAERRYSALPAEDVIGGDVLSEQRTPSVAAAREIFQLLDASDVGAVTQRCSERIRTYLDQGWSLEEHLRDVWHAGLDDLVGSRRTVSEVRQVSSTQFRLTVAGDRGEGSATIRFDEDGHVDGFALDREVFDGIANLVINCPDERVAEMKGFYNALLGEDYWRVPFLVFDEGYDYHAPQWGDPQRPQQMHIDVRVSDLDAAGAVVLGAGATALHDAGTHRIYADPIGHPFCLYPDTSPSGVVGELWRVVIDCPAPRELAPFYAQLIGMDLIEDSTDLVVLDRPDGRPPLLGFQRVSPYVPPAWPDPARPAQVHFDLKFDDAAAARSLAEELGATLQPTGGSCPVYTDPVGHPHCLCMHGQ
jgi:glyoxalase superfamily protein